MRQFLTIKYASHLLLLCSALLFSGCEKKYDSLIESDSTAPILTNAQFSLFIVNTDTINIGAQRKPNDVLTIRGILSTRVVHVEGRQEIGIVGYTLSTSFSDSTANEGLLQDDGVAPDSTPHDSIYSASVMLTIRRSDVGKYSLRLWSESRTGYPSNTCMFPLYIVRMNHAPVLSNLTAPDSLHRGDLLKLTVQASDSDGISDIYSVSYLSLKPDSTYANNGNQIAMFDDGNPDIPSADQTAGDGIYTYTTYVPSNALLGTYTYTFRSLDRSLAQSNVIMHKVKILP